MLKEFLDTITLLSAGRDRRGRLEILENFHELLPSEIWRKEMMTIIAELGEKDKSMRELFESNLKELSDDMGYIAEAKKAGVRWIYERNSYK